MAIRGMGGCLVGGGVDEMDNGSFSCNLTPWGGGEGDRTISVSYTPEHDCTLMLVQTTFASYDQVNYIHLTASYDGFKTFNNRAVYSWSPSNKVIEAVGLIPNAKAGTQYTIQSTVNMQAWQGNTEFRQWIELY